ncbi:MAG: 2-C-methyl-D-erythritol 4-phosphate cytidylyltransferase [Candidatus Hydrogenedentes bacterium]|nr:2-C-methyl-D-erythritol 4-phosphate cytidylyltransferase [Candidatus Hydrogenedentota bacterium]
MKTQLLVAAAGMGLRLGSQGPKGLVDLAGKPMLVRTLERFSGLGLTAGGLIVVPQGREGQFQELLAASFPGTPFTLVAGGRERQESVWNGLARLDDDTEIVVIHDAARPFVAAESVQASIDAAAEWGAATVAIPAVDTILVGDSGGFLADTPDREALWACQTPQTFRVDCIRAAHEHARRHGFLGTDDASLVRRAGGKVKLVMGTPLNLKVTTPGDLALAAAIVKGALL